MLQQQPDFGSLFKKFRLRSGFTTLCDFGDALAEKGFPFEDSLFSHWQKNTRIPKNRKILLAIISIFLEKGGITSIKDASLFLESVGQGGPTNKELTGLKKIDSNYFIQQAYPKNTLDFLLSTAHSKKIVRTGWIQKGIHNPESLAEHSFQLSIMAMVFANQFDVDREKLIKMAILHDLGGVVTGDVVWASGNAIDIEKRRKKESAEFSGISKIFKKINRAEEYGKIFEEMKERTSMESNIFWQLDKLEVSIQALIYEKEHNVDLDEFFVNADLQIYSPFLRKVFQQILAARPKFKKK